MTTAPTHPQSHNTRVIAVTPDHLQIAGDGNAALFLAQVLFWWKAAGRRKYYKFNSPCTHRLYRQGDSWMEELCLKRTMLCTARRRVAVKVRISSEAEIQAAFEHGALVVYGTDEHHLTWYRVNEQALAERSPALYARLVGSETPSAPPTPHPARSTPRSAQPTPHRPNPLLQTNGDGDSIPQSLPPARGNVAPQHSPMQGSDIGFNTEKTTKRAPENSFKKTPTENIPLPTPTVATTRGEGGEVANRDRRKIAFAIYSGLQERGVQDDPARLMARRAVRSGWDVEKTLEVFDAHVLDAERAGARSAVGVAVSRMLDGTQITPAPAWALARVRRFHRERVWAEPHDAREAVEQVDERDRIPEADERLVAKSPLKSLWEQVLGDIKLQVTRDTFEQRFRNTWLEEREGVYVVCAKDPYTVEWLAHRLQRMVTNALQRWSGTNSQPHFRCG